MSHTKRRNLTLLFSCSLWIFFIWLEVLTKELFIPNSSTKDKSLYSVHPGVTMVKEWIISLPKKAGRSLEEWINLIREHGPTTEIERRVWLKKKYNLGTNTAWWLTERVDGKGKEDSDPDLYLIEAEKWVDAMFADTKAGLLPIYHQLLKLGKKVGKDVIIYPCKTIVPFYRNHVIAQIKPSTRTRIDFGFALKNSKAQQRLFDTGGFAKGDRISHRIPITSLDEIDDEVKHWLKVAYDLDA